MYRRRPCEKSSPHRNTSSAIPRALQTGSYGLSGGSSTIPVWSSRCSFGRANPDTPKKRLRRLMKDKRALARILFQLQLAVERRLFREKATVDKARLVDQLKSIDSITMTPAQTGYRDLFSPADGERVRSYELDLLLRFGFRIIQGDILTAAKYGVWSFHHADNAVNRGGPPAFWEVAKHSATVGVTLQQLTPTLDGGLVIGKTYCNYQKNRYLATLQHVREASVALLFKHIDLLKEGIFETTPSLTYCHPLYRVPPVSVCLGYMLRFYCFGFKMLLRKMLQRVFHAHYNCWTLFIGNGSFLRAALYRLKPVTLPKGRFFADPFFFRDYVFFEDYCYRTQRGHIACGKLDGQQLKEIRPVLQPDYHLSYPQIFEEDGEIYMLPEASQNRRLELYRCVDFPDRWELYATAFEGERIIEATYTRQGDQRFLFLNKETDLYDSSGELYIYQIDSLKLTHITPHRRNPVIVDARYGRNGGALFTRDGQLYRPSQYLADGVYGRGLNIRKITKLSLSEYEEEPVLTALPHFNRKLIGMHHLHQQEDRFVFDAAYKRL